jgi:2-polyprenyl-3-methyl-5-hydroxy-6-metoxy-1,4-benzoquinol methylase
VDHETFAGMAEHDSTHWWYVARRDVLASVIAREVTLPPKPHILEIGCGTGHNLAMLARFGDVDAVELDAYARDIATKRLNRPVANAMLPELAGVPVHHYDLVALLDVLEHVEDDRAALAAIAVRLRPGGSVLLAVPQYPWMWTGHDVASHHFRRYTKATLRKAVDDAGLKLDLLQSFNSLLFPLAIVDRMAARITGKTGSDDAPPPAPINSLFTKVFAFERHLIGRVPMPPGLSLIALASAR